MERLIEWADALVGRVKGGLGHVTVVAAMGLSSVSGTAVADATALGGTLGPALSKAYGRPFGAALVAAASCLGPIIPPSAGDDRVRDPRRGRVGRRDVHRRNRARHRPRARHDGAVHVLRPSAQLSADGRAFSWRNVFYQTRRSFIVFMMPVIVIGGIIGGVFTATEGAAIAVVYALVIGFFITRKLKLSDLPVALLNAGIVSAIVGALIAFASQVTYLLTAEMVGVQIGEWLRSLTEDPLMFTFIVQLLLVVVGMFMESNAAYVMLVPIITPIAIQYGLDPVLFRLPFRDEHHARQHYAAGGSAPVRRLGDLAHQHRRDHPRGLAVHHRAVRCALRLHAVPADRAVPAQARRLLTREEASCTPRIAGSSTSRARLRASPARRVASDGRPHRCWPTWARWFMLPIATSKRSRRSRASDHRHCGRCRSNRRQLGSIEKLASAVGEIDVLINNAGVLVYEPLLDLKWEDLERVVSINLSGAIALTRLVGAGMVARRRGVIVHTGSQLTFNGAEFRAVYAATKAGISQFVKTAALEWGPHGVRVNCVAPGRTLTAINRHLLQKPEEYAEALKRIPLGRSASPWTSRTRSCSWRATRVRMSLDIRSSSTGAGSSVIDSASTWPALLTSRCP